MADDSTSACSEDLGPSSVISGESVGNRVVTVGLPNFLVTTSSTNVYADQEQVQTARVIIHTPSTPSLDAIKNVNQQQTITFNPLNRSLSVPEKNISFDPSVYEAILPVRCRTVKGDLHKSRFGSGNRGRSISVNGSWYTPSEFEALCGRGNSKDWKRSIRYGGRTLMCLIEQGVLRPHATSCTCAACCDDSLSEVERSPDAGVNGPVRLFTPYRRRKRKHPPKLKIVANTSIPHSENISTAPAEIHSEIISTNAASTESPTITVPLITSTRDSTPTVSPDSVIVNPERLILPKPSANFDEQKQWWQLEEMVSSTVRTVLDLQKQVEAVKKYCVASREASLRELRLHMDNEKKEALRSCRLEAQVSLSRALLQAKAEKEKAVGQAVDQARTDMHHKLHTYAHHKEDFKRCDNCDREAFSSCDGCGRASYCSSFCQQKDWACHKNHCMEGASVDADCSELVDTCDGSSN